MYFVFIKCNMPDRSVATGALPGDPAFLRLDDDADVASARRGLLCTLYSESANKISCLEITTLPTALGSPPFSP
jgi:hypothetical protein